MWFPVDDGMINLERVAYIEVESFAVVYYNDARAILSEASFSSEEDKQKYLERLQEELSYPLLTDENERFPDAERQALLEVSEGNGDDE